LKKYLILFFFISQNIFSIEMKCQFEEVYQNGDIQQGIILIKDNDVRYQYNDVELYTIIVKGENFILIDNKYKNLQTLNENIDIFKILVDALKNYPNIENQYKNENALVNIERSSSSFIKRISLISKDVNLSLNFMDCVELNINNEYFNYFDFKIFKE
jgi:hypothetical protein